MTSHTAPEPAAETETEYTDGQLAVLELLPATSTEIGDELDISRSAVRGRIHRMDDVTLDGDVYRQYADADFPDETAEADDGGKWRADGASADDVAVEQQPPVRADRITTSASKQTVTRKATEALADIERQTANLLSEARERGSLASKPQGKSGEVDVLIPRGDDHFGDAGETYDHDAGEVVEIFNLDIAQERVRQCTLDVVEKVTRFEDVYDFGTCHFALLGDSVTGEDIFSSQPHEIDAELREQIDVAAETYFESIAVLADVFDHVHVPTVPGNHGEIRTGSASSSNNADDFVYDRVESMVRVSDLDNVSFTRSWRTKFVDFNVRGWKVHARHGQDSLSHIGTSSGKNRWRGWLDQSDFDIGLRQHYHEKKREPVRGRPVLMSGSISPPGDFEESLSEYSPPGGMLYFIGDGQRPIEATFDIHFEE